MREAELCAVESAENLQTVTNLTQVGIAPLVQQSATIQGVVCKVVTCLLFDLAKTCLKLYTDVFGFLIQTIISF